MKNIIAITTYSLVMMTFWMIGSIAGILIMSSIMSVLTKNSTNLGEGSITLIAIIFLFGVITGLLAQIASYKIGLKIHSHFTQTKNWNIYSHKKIFMYAFIALFGFPIVAVIFLASLG